MKKQFMQFIKQIDIRKFRSINGLTKIKTTDLNIFVGQNDQGKSNVLRALNLFLIMKLIQIQDLDTKMITVTKQIQGVALDMKYA